MAQNYIANDESQSEMRALALGNAFENYVTVICKHSEYIRSSTDSLVYFFGITNKNDI